MPAQKGRDLMIRNALTAAALAALALTATACNTVDGIGDDIKSVGQAGKRAID
jgi:predicted small secreted protein